MCIFNRERIPKDILESSYAAVNSCKSHRLEDGIALLKSFDLISFTEDNCSFTMHRLVQLSTRHWLRECSLVDAAVHAIVHSLDSSFPQKGSHYGGILPEVWQSCRQLISHIEEVISLATQAEYVGESGDVFYRAAIFYATIGRYDKAIEVARRIWQAYAQQKGEHAKVTLEKATVLGRWLCDKGRCNEVNACWGKYISRGRKCPIRTKDGIGLLRHILAEYWLTRVKSTRRSRSLIQSSRLQNSLRTRKTRLFLRLGRAWLASTLTKGNMIKQFASILRLSKFMRQFMVGSTSEL